MPDSPTERLDALEEALEQDGGDVRCWSERGLCLLELGRVEEALMSFERAAELSPNGPDLYQAGCAQLKLGRPHEALHALDRSLELSPEHAPAWVQRGIALYHLVRFYDAQLAFDRALQLDGTLVQAWRCRASLRLDQEDLDGAEGDYRAIAELHPDSAEPWLELGWCLSRLPADWVVEQQPEGRERRAIAAFDKAMELDPSRTDGWEGKAEVLLRLLHAAQRTERASLRVPLVSSPASFSSVFYELALHLDQAMERFPDAERFLDLRAEATEMADESL